FREPARAQDREAAPPREVGWVRRARLYADHAAVAYGQTGRHHHGAALGDGRVHHAARGQGVDLRAGGARGRAVPDPLRATRVAGPESLVPEAAEQPGAQSVVAGE